ncbi:hypothetical protein [Vibrio sp. 03_296]|uniref:hypothetical protein n=1 Tax=Vibrio sp. 03_296 TaxID=2024409 RepID=UPI002D808AA0|nr:hypothetical protein [Vibrio sp. 03_296]
MTVWFGIWLASVQLGILTVVININSSLSPSPRRFQEFEDSQCLLVGERRSLRTVVKKGDGD